MRLEYIIVLVTKGWKNIYFLAKKSWKNTCFCPKRLENSFLVSVVTLYNDAYVDALREIRGWKWLGIFGI